MEHRAAARAMLDHRYRVDVQIVVDALAHMGMRRIPPDTRRTTAGSSKLLSEIRD